MMKNRFMEYGLDLQYEFKTYKYVGKDYGDRKIANKGWIKNLCRFWRKCISNRKEQKYKFCNTYSQWQNHVIEVVPKGINNYNDLLHWLISEKRETELQLETVKIVLLPILLAILGLESILTNTDVAIVFVVVIAVGRSTYLIYDAMKKVVFYDEFIALLENENKEKTK